MDGTIASQLPPAEAAMLPPNVDRRHAYTLLIWTTLAFSALFISTRLYIRVRVKKAVGCDDYLIVLAWAAQVPTTVFAQLAENNGMLLHIYYLTPSQTANTLKWIQAVAMCCTIVPVLIKLSICVSILRLITNARRNVTIAIWILMGILTLTGAATFLVQVMQCLPMNKLWDPTVPGKCMSMQAATWVLVAYGIVCVVTDFICGIVPIIILRNLQMDRLTKVALIILLGLVLVPGICSVFRTITTVSLNNPDISWSISGVATWVCLEVQIGFIIACLPMLWSPVVAAFKLTASYVSAMSSDHSSRRQWRSGQHRLESQASRTDKSGSNAAPLGNHDYGFPLHTFQASAGMASQDDDAEHLIKDNRGILCCKDVQIYASPGSETPANVRAPAMSRDQRVISSWA